MVPIKSQNPWNEFHLEDQNSIIKLARQHNDYDPISLMKNLEGTLCYVGNFKRGIPNSSGEKYFLRYYDINKKLA